MLIYFSVGQYVCLAFYRRGTHAAEMQLGSPTVRSEDACSSSYFEPNRSRYITLVSEYLKVAFKIKYLDHKFYKIMYLQRATQNRRIVLIPASSPLPV